MIRIRKIPIIEIGTMVYFKDDPERKPYKWKYWDDVEMIVDNSIKFVNKKDRKYRYIIEFKWSIRI